MRKGLSLLPLCLLMAVLSQPLQSEESMKLFRLGTGGAGGTYYPIGLLIARAISRPPGSSPCDDSGPCGVPGLVAIAQAANGSVANVTDIQRGLLESGFSQSDVAHWAYTGTGTFRRQQPMNRLRTIASLYPESVHLVVRRGSGIRSLRDLHGKRVALDEPGSGTLIDAEILLQAFGLSKQQLKVEYSKFRLAAERLRAGKLDAFFVVTGYPATAVGELWQDGIIDLVPIDGPEVNQIIRDYPFFTRGRIPAAAYEGMPATIDTINVQAQWLTSSDVDDELIYQITRALWDQRSRRLLQAGHPKGREIRLRGALDALTTPLHPGAARYYREQGMLKGS